MRCRFQFLIQICLISTLVAAERPNLVFIVTDDQRADTLGCMGNEVVHTPELDALAAEGILFENAFVTTSICSVSRACILLGQEARNTGIRDFAKPFSEAQLSQTYPALLRNAGYFVGFLGKWGVGADDLEVMDRVGEEFDFWAGFSHQGNFWHQETCAWVNHGKPCDCETPDGRAGYLPRTGPNYENGLHLTHDILPQQVEAFLDAADEEKPFCLSVFMKAPHGPWQDWHPSMRDVHEKEEDKQFPISPSINLDHAQSRPEYLRTMLEASRGMEFVEKEEYRQLWMAHYYRQVAAIDRFLGVVRTSLRQRNLDQNTVLIFTSDNGHLLGEHGLYGKWLMYEESIRIPLIIYDPRRTFGKRQQMVLNTDLAPTLLDLAEVTVPPSMDGASLVPLLDEPDNFGRSAWFYEHDFTLPPPMRIPPSEGVRTGAWKYIRYYDEPQPVEELYDLREDPYEMNSLAADPQFQDVLTALRTKWLILRSQ